MNVAEEGADRERRDLGRGTVRTHQHSMEALRDPHPKDVLLLPGESTHLEFVNPLPLQT